MVRGVSWSIYWYLFMRSTDLNLSAPLTWVFWISLGVHYSPPPIPHCWESHNQNSYLKLKPHSIFRVTLFVWKKLRQTKAESFWKLNYKYCVVLSPSDPKVEMSRPNGDQSCQLLSLSTVTVTQQKSWNGKAKPAEHAMFFWGLLS